MYVANRFAQDYATVKNVNRNHKDGAKTQQSTIFLFKYDLIYFAITSSNMLHVIFIFHISPLRF